MGFNLEEVQTLAAQGKRQSQIARRLRCAQSNIYRHRQIDPDFNEAIVAGWKSYFERTGINLIPPGPKVSTPKPLTSLPKIEASPSEPNTVRLSDTVVFRYSLDGDIFTLNKEGREKLTWLIEALRTAVR